MSIDLSLSQIVASIIGTTFGILICLQYKLINAIKDEREINETLRDEIQAMADRIHLLRQEKCELEKKTCTDVVTQSTGSGAAPGREKCVTDTESEE